MTIEIITNLIILAASLLGFIYGLFTILIRKRPLYLKMVVLAVACMMISRIYLLLQYLTGKDIPDGFHVGILCMLGCFLFLFSANFGMIDGLADDGSMKFLKYRLISWIVPIVLIASFVPMYAFDNISIKLIAYSVVLFVVAISARFHFKHLILPDVDYGVVRQIRGYNAVALFLCLSTTVMLVADLRQMTHLYMVAGCAMALFCLIILPILKKEAMRWTKI